MAGAGKDLTEHDVIVVGGGSAGCLVAGRLAAETSARVLLLESGGRNASPLIDIPAGFSRLLGDETYTWPYVTVPQRHLDGRSINLVQGRGLGGGSAINAMVYMRGQPRDYDGWQTAVGGSGNWSYSHLLPYFQAMEGSDIFSGPFHGERGPLRVSQPRQIAPINQAIMRAFQDRGLPYNADYNGAEQRGVSPCQLTIGDDRRCSALHAFLAPAEGRANLTVTTDALVTRILMHRERANGVEYVSGGETHRAFAAEIVLTAGALSTPRLLMVSGIGPEDELSKHGIEVRVDAPEVGRNLHDHPQAPIIAGTHKELGYAADATGYGVLKAGLRYYTTHTGPASSNGIETVSHFDPDNFSGEPTIQCFHVPVIAEKALAPPDKHPGITLETVVLQPKSRGSLTLKDADPRSLPLVDPNYLSDPEDVRRLVTGLRYVREILDTPALRDLVEPERTPGALVQSDEDLAAYARRAMSCMLHPVGTCRMGSDNGAVVDASLRVNGVSGLRVMDASIMPNIVSANTNAAVMVIASKGLELMRKELGL